MNENIGPRSYENWKAALLDKNSYNAYEVPLFTDAHITGEIRDGFGPYQFLNPVPIPRLSGSTTPGVILRVEDYLGISLPSTAEMSRTNDRLYHGGLLHDEIAALASLILGVRFKAGGITREFDLNKDPRGKPVLYEMSRDPILLLDGENPIIPRARSTKPLNKLSQLLTYSSLIPEDAITLVRASRLYQDALWIAESEPELAWIMFVSAIETAANRWCKIEYTAVEKLHVSMPDLVWLLDEQGGPDLIKEVAELVVPYVGATRKFIDFVLKFWPPPPENRPIEESNRHPWDMKNKVERMEIEKTLRKIYDYRSKSLHGGTRFPAPMCMPPTSFKGHPIEVPIGLAMSAQGGNWLRKDTPLLLPTFECIVRGALLKWWDSLIPKASLE